MKNWAVVKVRLRVTGEADYENSLQYHYDASLSPEIVELFDYEQEAVDYLSANGREISSDALATIVEVENITQW